MQVDAEFQAQSSGFNFWENAPKPRPKTHESYYVIPKRNRRIDLGDFWKMEVGEMICSGIVECCDGMYMLMTDIGYLCGERFLGEYCGERVQLIRGENGVEVEVV